MTVIIPRDDRAWPRSSAVVSAVIGLLAVAAGVGLTAAAVDRGAVPAAVVGGAFVVVLAVELAVYLAGIRPWLRGGEIPPALAYGQVLAFGAGVLVFLVDAAVGGALLAGLVAGMMAGNVWSIRLARRNRGRVDEAEAAGAAERAAAPATRRPVTGPAPPIGRVLRDTVATERRRALAWLTAGGLAAAGGAALDASEAVRLVVLVLAAAAVLWVLRRLWGGWLALRDFTRAATPPLRAYVVLLHDPAPRIVRPLLGIWSQPPEVRGGRLPRPERVYRCDEEQVDLLCVQAAVAVHEAWIDSGPRPSSKPRWVSADAGLALPHRRALLGRWYLSSLLSAARPGPPEPLTQPPPGPDPVVEPGRAGGGFLTAVAVRLAALAAAGLVVHWLG